MTTSVPTVSNLPILNMVVASSPVKAQNPGRKAHDRVLAQSPKPKAQSPKPELGENVAVTLSDFKASTSSPEPPAGLSSALLALWYDARGDWEKAHETAQDMSDTVGAWIHAYLHRKEGDLGNAAYWYRRAGKPESRDGLDAEWESIATTVLAGRP
jgi:hypothetical protein